MLPITKILDPFSLCPVSSFTLVHWAKHYCHPYQGDGTKLKEMDGFIGKNNDCLHTEECMAQLATVYFSVLGRLKYEVLCIWSGKCLCAYVLMCVCIWGLWVHINGK